MKLSSRTLLQALLRPTTQAAFVSVLACVGAFGFSRPAAAAHKLLYIHGKADRFCYNGTIDRCYKDGDYNSKYWSSGTAGPVRDMPAFYVGWNGTSNPREWGRYVNGFDTATSTETGDGPAWNRAQSQLHAAIWWGDHPRYGGASCWGDNTCTIICHSTGCLAVDYYFAHFDPAWDQTHLGPQKVYRILAASSASGGSDLVKHRDKWYAGVADFFGLDPGANTWLGDHKWWPVTDALLPETARNFNHHATYGKPSYHLAGHRGNHGSAFMSSSISPSAYLPGFDDGVVAFHSQCAYDVMPQYGGPDIQLCNAQNKDCAEWSSCPWYNPFCTQYCRRPIPYPKWSNHYVPDGSGMTGYSAFNWSYDRDHLSMRALPKLWLEAGR